MEIKKISGHTSLVVVLKQNPIEKLTKGCILLFPKGDLGITQNYTGIILTAVLDVFFNSMILKRIQPTILEIILKNQKAFQRFIYNRCLSIVYIYSQHQKNYYFNGYNSSFF